MRIQRLTTAASVRLAGLFALAVLAACEPAKPPVDEEEEPIEELDAEIGDLSDGVDAADAQDAKDSSDAKAEVKDTADAKADSDAGNKVDGGDAVQDSPDAADNDASDAGDAADAAEVAAPGDGDGDGQVEDAGDAGAEVDAGPPPSCKLDAECAKVPLAPCSVTVACKVDKAGLGQCVQVLKNPGAQCDDSNACTLGDECSAAGACLGVPAVCGDTDNNVCTFEVCVPGKGCPTVGKPAPDEAPCNDGNACTVGDVCFNGKCNAGEDNKCECKVDADCKKFNDDNLCNGALKCDAGIGGCVFDKSKVVLCDAKADTPCLVNTCEPKTGACAPKKAVNGTWCDDGTACTTVDQCSEGICIYKKLNCNDSDQCTTDLCDAKLGCTFTQNNYSCDDGDVCTADDVCQVGKCIGKPTPGIGVCACSKDADCPNDNDLCNGVYQCSAGTCQLKPGSVVICAAASAGGCVTQQCVAKKGACETVLAPVGSACEDGDACTQSDACTTQGQCQGQKPLACNDGNPCTDDSCLVFAGCLHLPNQAACDDGDFCTSGDVCGLGKCQSGAASCSCKADSDCQSKFANANKCLGPYTCDKTSKQCEVDPAQATVCDKSKDSVCAATACNPASGTCDKVNAVTGLPCNDGDPCLIDDVCQAGACKGQVPQGCDDGNPCTADLCDSANKAAACKHDAAKSDGLPCSDGDACTTGLGDKDSCQGGKCQGPVVNCGDVDGDCVIDTCNPQSGCIKSSLPVKSPCDDGNPCTGDKGNPASEQDECNNLGACKPGPAKDCSTSNSCLDAVCDPKALPETGKKLGCVYAYNSAVCNDQDQCTEGETCDQGACKTGKPIVCDDKNACTDDACDKNIGCVHTPNKALCDDGNLCTEADACAAGVCGGKAKACDDENVCTTDALSLIHI